jgi:hypothetical protein
MISMPGSASTSSGNVGIPHAVAHRRGNDDRQFQWLLQLWPRAARLCFNSTDASHEADLMIDEDERRVL